MIGCRAVLDWPKSFKILQEKPKHLASPLKVHRIKGWRTMPRRGKNTGKLCGVATGGEPRTNVLTKAFFTVDRNELQSMVSHFLHHSAQDLSSGVVLMVAKESAGLT